MLFRSCKLFPSHDIRQIKLPQLRATLTIADNPYQANNNHPWTQINPSCLLAYLGVRGYASPKASGDKGIGKNALPILTYFDIFKNYYANTQEENFYMIGETPKLSGVKHKAGDNYETKTPDKINIGIANEDKVLIYPINTYNASDLTVTWFDAANEITRIGKPTIS